MVKSSVGREVYALSEMVDHMLLLEDFREPFAGMNPGVVGLRESVHPPQDQKGDRRRIPGTPFFEYSAGLGGRWPGKCVLATRGGESRGRIDQCAARRDPPFATP